MICRDMLLQIRRRVAIIRQTRENDGGKEMHMEKRQGSREPVVGAKYPSRPRKAKKPVEFKALRRTMIKKYPKIISELAK